MSGNDLLRRSRPARAHRPGRGADTPTCCAPTRSASGDGPTGAAPWRDPRRAPAPTRVRATPRSRPSGRRSDRSSPSGPCPTVAPATPTSPGYPRPFRRRRGAAAPTDSRAHPPTRSPTSADRRVDQPTRQLADLAGTRVHELLAQHRFVGRRPRPRCGSACADRYRSSPSRSSSSDHRNGTAVGTPDSRCRTVLTSFEPHHGGTRQPRNSIGSQPDTSSGRQFASNDHWTPPTLRATPQRHPRLNQAVMAFGFPCRGRCRVVRGEVGRRGRRARSRSRRVTTRSRERVRRSCRSRRSQVALAVALSVVQLAAQDTQCD